MLKELDVCVCVFVCVPNSLTSEWHVTQYIGLFTQKLRKDASLAWYQAGRVLCDAARGPAAFPSRPDLGAVLRRPTARYQNLINFPAAALN